MEKTKHTLNMLDGWMKLAYELG